jgi:uncharacterized protein (TIGR01777 family)
MRVAVTGATGLIGRRLVAALTERGDSVVAVSRDPERAKSSLGVEAVSHDGPFDGFDAVVNLAGEPVAQRWTAAAKERIRSSRVDGTTRLVGALSAASPRPSVLVSASAAGYYGDRGDEQLDESAAAGDDFLASVCRDWEDAALAATSLGIRVACVRNGVVLARDGGALPKLLPPFRFGVGGPIGGGKQWMPWIALDDVVGLFMAALDGGAWSGPINGCAPNVVTNAVFSRELGRALHRPAIVPVPGFALRALYGEMASMVLGGQRMVPARALELGYEFRYEIVGEALRAALGA